MPDFMFTQKSIRYKQYKNNQHQHYTCIHICYVCIFLVLQTEAQPTNEIFL